MRTARSVSWRLAKLLPVANGVFWVVFAVYFQAKSFQWRPHAKLFEEVSPPYVFWGHAFPFAQYMSHFMRFTRLLQWPSFRAATPFNLYLSHRGIVVDDLFWGVSAGGYYLIIVGVLSFLQWYLIGVLIDYTSSRMNAAPTDNLGHAHDLRQ